MFSKVIANRVRTKVLVSVKTGEAFEGVLWDADKQALVLRGASMVGVAGDAPAAVDGEVVVLMGDVAYIQILG